MRTRERGRISLTFCITVNRLEDYRWRLSLPAKTSINLHSKHHYRSFQVLLSRPRYFSRLLPIASYNSRNNRELFNAVTFYGKQLSAIYLMRRRLAYVWVNIIVHTRNIRVACMHARDFQRAKSLIALWAPPKPRSLPPNLARSCECPSSLSFLPPFVLLLVLKPSGRDDI